MEYVFISYSSKSEPTATAIAACLEGIGATCFVYQRPTAHTAVDSDTLTKIKNQVEGSTFFIQVLDGHAGFLVSNFGSTPILQLEMEWFLKASARLGGKRPLPLVISFEPTTTGDERSRFDRFVQWFQEEGVGYEPGTDTNGAIRVAVGWFTRHRYAPSEIAAIEGSLDIDVSSPPVDQAFESALVRNQPLPQKYLYTSPVAAILWKKLLGAKKSPTNHLYETIDYRKVTLRGIRVMLNRIQECVHTMPISVIALGCGSGRREQQLVSTLSNALPHRRVQVLLVDVSKTLISDATSKFASGSYGNSDAVPGINFALADFEHPRSVASLMRRWSGDRPSISILLGNTLGNIDAATFLSTLASAMKVGDLLGVEVKIANEGERRLTSDASWQNVKPQRDEHFEFICGPIRALGITPVPERYRTKSVVGDHAIHRYYGYKLTSEDMENIQAVVGHSFVNDPLLQLVKVDTFFEDTLPSLFPQSLRIVSKDIEDCHRLMSHKAPTKMGFVVAEKVNPSSAGTSKN